MASSVLRTPRAVHGRKLTRAERLKANLKRADCTTVAFTVLRQPAYVVGLTRADVTQELQLHRHLRGGAQHSAVEPLLGAAARNSARPFGTGHGM